MISPQLLSFVKRMERMNPERSPVFPDFPGLRGVPFFMRSSITPATESTTSFLTIPFQSAEEHVLLPEILPPAKGKKRRLSRSDLKLAVTYVNESLALVNDLKKLPAGILTPAQLQVFKRGVDILRQARATAIWCLTAGRLDEFFALLSALGPFLLRQDEVYRVIEGWWRVRDTDPQAAEHLRRIGDALACVGSGRSPKQRSSTEEDEIQVTLRKEYQFVREFRKIDNTKYNNHVTKNRRFAQKLHLSPTQVRELYAEGRGLQPKQWAIKRTATHTGRSPEHIRRTLLAMSKKNK